MEQPAINACPELCRRDCATDTAVELRYLLTMAIGKALSLTETAALPLADRIADNLFAMAGGREFYVPKVDRKRRNAAIREAFNGQNMEELCRRYGVSKSQLYRIVG